MDGRHYKNPPAIGPKSAELFYGYDAAGNWVPRPAARRTPVEVGRKSYVVVHDDIGVIRVEYNNAVMGRRNLRSGTQVHKSVLTAFAALTNGQGGDGK